MNMTGARERKNPYAEEAARNLAGFEFTCLTPGMVGIEAWRCKKPETGIYSFDIVITNRGIAVVGDIDGLLFQHGYGMDFLAGNDVGHYMHSKLEPQCQDKEFDESAFLFACADYALNALEGADIEVDEADLRAHDRFQVTPHETIRKLLDVTIPALGNQTSDQDALKVLNDVAEFLRDARGYAVRGDLHEIQEFLSARAGDGIVSTEWYETRLERPSHNLMVRLHMINQAAKAIVEIKNKPVPEATSTRSRP